MADPVKKRIVDRTIELLQAMQAQGLVRKIERVHVLFLEEKIKPALHVVVGDEQQIGQDNRGYTMEFPIGFQLIFSELRDPEAKGDIAIGFIQQNIEADPQLNSLANEIVYAGAETFFDKTLSPDGYIVASYVIQYRRERARPDVSY